MGLMAEKDLSRELEIDRQFLSLAKGRTKPPTVADYEKSARGPRAKQMQRMMKKFFGFEPKIDSKVGHELAMTNWVGDPLSDVAILKIRRSGVNPHKVINQMIEKGIDGVENPPEELVAIWKEVSEDPEWLDWDKLELGAKAYRRFGVLGFQFQGINTIDSYRVETIARVLMSTGQYSDETAFKRFVLTCNFWLQISEPGGMRPYAEGWKVSLRVRLLHTLIRRAVFANKRWDAEHLGTPINQLGMMAAPLMSSLMLGKFTHLIGFRTTDTEIEAMMHLWRYIAYIMGYSSPHFPTTVDEALQTVFHAFNLSPLTDDPDGIRLGQSFLAAFRPTGKQKGWEKVKRWWEYKVNIAQTLFFVQPETRKLIKSPNPVFWGMIYWLTHAPIYFLQDRKRHKSAAYWEELDKRVSAQRRAWLNRQLGESDLLYRPESKF
ncbi:DUF2236 domain-containing protein [Bradyrhizobium sp. KBS0727]|uniref:oxygenase MpaB family protein n=1 Tax=unclassified Bradyrhizobium TaxID=2631580 RepID=UPI00110D8D7F|nr:MULTISPECIES: oxygenase MpaB family protein [unclassified Bradyrhizobium]QDW40562.1 DUF2236 domain-containing protein [Bradyrhizobium sp. KBS0725]QDW47167.1 DUF2236 domain-containing protein [Bradyrhizobium sp. KBS0727]